MIYHVELTWSNATPGTVMPIPTSRFRNGVETVRRRYLVTANNLADAISMAEAKEAERKRPEYGYRIVCATAEETDDTEVLP